MRKLTSLLLYFVAGLPLLLSFLLMVSFRPWALDGDFWKRTLTDDRLYSILLSPELKKDVQEKVVLGGYTLSGPALVEALQKEAPVAELKALSVSGVDAIFPPVALSRTVSQELDLRALKKALTARSGALAADYVAALPVLAQRPEPKDLSFRPQGLAESLVVTRAREATSLVVATQIPDALPWPPKGKDPDPNPEIGLALANLGANRLDLATASLGLGSALVLTLLALIGAGRLERRLALAGGFVLAPSVLILVAGVFLSAGSTVVVGSLNIPALHIPELSGGVVETRLLSWAADSVARVAKSFFVVGLGGTFFGGLLLALRKFVRRDDQDQ